MSATTPTFSQIKAQVTAIHQKLPMLVRLVFMRRGDGQGKQSDATDDVYAIHQCDSPLAMRVALRLPIEEGATKSSSPPSMKRIWERHSAPAGQAETFPDRLLADRSVPLSGACG